MLVADQATTQANGPLQLLDLDDHQVRGVVARLLRASGLTPQRAARVMRSSRPTFYRDLAVPLPGQAAVEG